MLTQYVYDFSSKSRHDDETDRDLLGGKGAALAAMSRAGLPVPPGFTVSTAACGLHRRSPAQYASIIKPEINRALERLEAQTGERLGDIEKPLLISVRSGAKFSMPGMMDTVLDIGLNDRIVARLAETTGNPRFAYDCYRRLLQMFGDVVLGVPLAEFETVLAGQKAARGVNSEIELSADDLEDVCRRFRAIIQTAGKTFPDEPRRQMDMAIEAVFASWDNARAVTYRRMNAIPESLGTAVNVQRMVFGNRGPGSASGVGFTRNPATGAKALYGEYLPEAQGEEVVAGTRTPLPFARLEEQMPKIYAQLVGHVQRLESYYRDMQDFEFTIEEGVLHILQTRSGKRTGRAAVRIATDLHAEGRIDLETALKMVPSNKLDELLHPIFVPHDRPVLATGLPASPGAAVGRVVFTADDAVAWKARGEQVILVRGETTPDDIHGMEAAQGVLTMRGGMTSHAAVVARGMGKCAVVGCEALEETDDDRVRIHDATFGVGDWLSVDGAHGAVFEGQIDRVEPSLDDPSLAAFVKLVESVDGALTVRANADTPRDAKRARSFGARGIGLCRTEHMFFGEERLQPMQRLILADSRPARREAAQVLKPFQRKDFYELLSVMDGLPVTVRLLDPPLHEFLPSRAELEAEVRALEGQSDAPEAIEFKRRLLHRLDELEEVNPMLGHRGCRLGVTYPEVTRMQVEALFEAATRLIQEGRDPRLEVMVPLVSMKAELEDQLSVVRNAIAYVREKTGVEVPHLFGTMIELPRAALAAEALAEHAQFFSFGTNDMTQTAFGLSRDDAQHVLDIYLKRGIIAVDPFQSIDQQGVGRLVEMACESGRRGREDIQLGVCGEHGGDPDSVAFFHRLGLDYVSCSPFRVLGARLAAAQAVLASA